MRRFLRGILPIFLIMSLVIVGFACGGGGGDEKSPFELLSNRVASLEAKVANLDNVSPSDVQQLRLDLDALAAQLNGIEAPDNTEVMNALLTDFADLVVRVDDLENGMVSGEDGLSCRPLNMMFLAEAGGDNPLPQTLVVGVLADTSWYAFEGSPWLRVAPTAGAESMILTVAVDITDMAEGVYYATIAVITVSEVVEISVTLGILTFP